MRRQARNRAILFASTGAALPAPRGQAISDCLKTLRSPEQKKSRVKGRSYPPHTSTKSESQKSMPEIINTPFTSYQELMLNIMQMQNVWRPLLRGRQVQVGFYITENGIKKKILVCFRDRSGMKIA